MYRGEKELHIKEWWWEEDVIITENMVVALKQAFEQFCSYLGAENVNKEDFENKCLNKKQKV